MKQRQSCIEPAPKSSGRVWNNYLDDCEDISLAIEVLRNPVDPVLPGSRQA